MMIAFVRDVMAEIIAPGECKPSLACGTIRLGVGSLTCLGIVGPYGACVMTSSPGVQHHRRLRRLLSTCRDNALILEKLTP